MKLSARELFKDTPSRTPWPRMVLCGLGTGVPLFAGLVLGDLRSCIYGALIGYLVALNDHLGVLSKRFGILTLTFAFLLSGFVMGMLLQSVPIVSFPVFAALIYWVGLLGGDGAEFERALLFLTLSIVIALFSQLAPLNQFEPVIWYSILAYVAVAIAMPVLEKIHQYHGEPVASVRGSLKKTFARTRANHIYAASYTFTGLLALWMAQHFAIERGYWIVVTVLLVMRADRTLAVYVILQRLIGTALGVLLFDVLVHFVPLSAIVFVILAVASACVLPLALKRNYLFASFLVTAFVLSLLELALPQLGDTATAFLRLRATAIGCGLAVCGTVVSKVGCWVVEGVAPREG